MCVIRHFSGARNCDELASKFFVQVSGNSFWYQFLVPVSVTCVAGLSCSSYRRRLRRLIYAAIDSGLSASSQYHWQKLHSSQGDSHHQQLWGVPDCWPQTNALPTACPQREKLATKPTTRKWRRS